MEDSGTMLINLPAVLGVILALGSGGGARRSDYPSCGFPGSQS